MSDFDNKVTGEDNIPAVDLWESIIEDIKSWHESQLKRTASRCSFKTCTCLTLLDDEVGAKFALKPKKK